MTVTLSVADPATPGPAFRSALKAEAYVAVTRVEGLVPSATYLCDVLRGMQERELPADYIDAVASACNAHGCIPLPREFRLVSAREPTFEAMRSLRALLAVLRYELVPSAAYGRAALAEFARTAIARQRGHFANIAEPGSWALTRCGHPMPADVRVSEVFYPTYLVVAILSRLRKRDLDLVASIDRYDRALSRGMRFVCHRGLAGSGVGATRGLCDAVEILADGGVPELLAERPDLCPELWALLREVKARLADASQSAPVVSQGFGTVPRDVFAAALSRLAAVADA